jgi:D-aminoacyl-tRNA deacylase
MKAVIQRVSKASVSIDGIVVGAIERGLLVLLGVEERDSLEDVAWLSAKIAGLRIFGDHEGKMNLDLIQIKGSVLIVSQFTLHALTKKGNRPSFIKAAKPEQAIPLYESFIEAMGSLIGELPATGQFGADMQVELINDGPVTIIIDTQNKE